MRDEKAKELLVRYWIAEECGIEDQGMENHLLVEKVYLGIMRMRDSLSVAVKWPAVLSVALPWLPIPVPAPC
jgi:hypothetical protein